MRIVYGILAAFMLLFAIVQYNDPDAVFWIGVYGLSAIWCALAALKSPILNLGPVRVLFTLSLLLAVAGVVWFWPTVAEWWRQDIWWNVETAREGMGMMIVVICLGIASLGILRRV